MRWHSPITDRYRRDSDAVTVPFNQAAADDRISHCLASDCPTNLILISSPLHWTGQPRSRRLLDYALAINQPMLHIRVPSPSPSRTSLPLSRPLSPLLLSFSNRSGFSSRYVQALYYFVVLMHFLKYREGDSNG